MVTVSLAQAQTYWTGSNTTFTNPGNNTTDILTSIVILTRGTTGGGLYNIANQSSPFVGAAAPAGTQWGVGTLAGYMSNPSSVTFGNCPLEAGMRPPNDIGKTYVIHLVTNNIYLQLTLNSWGGGIDGGVAGSYSYTRSTPPAAAPPPAISITSPANGAVFAAPASEKITVNATVSSGTVTNVQFFTNNVSVGNVSAPTPFTLTPTLAAGSYALTAAATAAGISTTSSVVNISVVTPITVALTNETVTSGPGFQFSYSANVGLSYVIDRATDLVLGNWVPIATNVAASDPTNYLDTHATSNPAFYRVGRLPNP